MFFVHVKKNTGGKFFFKKNVSINSDVDVQTSTDKLRGKVECSGYRQIELKSVVRAREIHRFSVKKKKKFLD